MKKSTIRVYSKHYIYLFLPLLGLVASCQGQGSKSTANRDSTVNTADSIIESSEYGHKIIPQTPMHTPSSNKFAKIVGWKEGATPNAKSGYKVVRFAEDLNSPRNIYVAPNGDIFVSQARTEKAGEDDEKIDSRNKFRDKSPNNIIRFRDRNKDGISEEKEVFLSELAQPYGMLILGNYFYVANTDGLVRFPYNPSTGKVQNKAEKIASLPAGGYNNHWTRNIIANK